MMENYNGNNRSVVKIEPSTIPKYNPTLAYIQYMKFTRRVDNLSEVRKVFRRARLDKRCTYHIYISNALMQYHCGEGAKLAYNLFVLGRKKFPNNKNFLLHYIDFLTHLTRFVHIEWIFVFVLLIVQKMKTK